MNSDKQIKVAGGASMSYHVLVETLVKKFTNADTIMFDGKFANQDEFMKALAEKLNDYATKLEICHSAIGIHTEAGEVADVLKAYAIYGKDLDRAALVKELGDLRFWVMDIQNKFFISDHEIAQGNADKLAERYKKVTYSDEAAIARVDKKYVVCESEAAYIQGNYEAGPFEHYYEAEAYAVSGGMIPSNCIFIVTNK